jgi:hypothetical protein
MLLGQSDGFLVRHPRECHHYALWLVEGVPVRLDDVSVDDS